MKADRIADPWGARVPYRRHEAWPSRVDSYLTEGVEPGAVQRWVGAASLLHSGGDAMDIAVVDGRMVGVRGRAADRVSRGRLGPKDLFGWQANASSDRLTRPLVRRDGHLVETDWDTAMELVAARTRALLDERGPGSIGFYTSGQLFLEEYYTLAVLARAGIGTNPSRRQHAASRTHVRRGTGGAAAPARSAGPAPGRHGELPVLGDARAGRPGDPGRTAAGAGGGVSSADAAADALVQHADQTIVPPGAHKPLTRHRECGRGHPRGGGERTWDTEETSSTSW